MDTSRGSMRLGTFCLVGMLVMLTAVPVRVGYTARLATEEAPATKRAPQRGAAQDRGSATPEARRRAPSISTFAMPTSCRSLI